MGRLNVIFIFYFLLNSHLGYTQYCTIENRFTEVQYFSSNEIGSNLNVTYARDVLDWEGNLQDLQMDVYYPEGNNENLSQRPFILLIHGGGFQGGSRTSMRADCIRFARRGYVSATISYRLGYEQSDTNALMLAVYRAQQDANAALRFVSQNADIVNIDTSWIFIGGRSAGAVTALNTVYTNPQDWDRIVPNVESILGPLNTSGNSLNASFSLKGILNNWGSTPALGIDASEMLPTIAFHGVLDNTVPIDSSETIGFVGSGYIHNALLENGICSELTVDSLGGHGIYTNASGSEFRAERASCFFKSIICDNCTSSNLTDELAANCSENTTSVSQVMDANSVKCYPNPMEYQFTVEVVKDNFDIKLLDSNGAVLKEFHNVRTSHTFNVHTLSSGIYFLSIRNLRNQEFHFEKIIKK